MSKLTIIVLLLLSFNVVHAQQWIQKTVSDIPELLNENFINKFLVKKGFEKQKFNGDSIVAVWYYAYSKNDTSKLAFKWEEGYWDNDSINLIKSTSKSCISYLYDNKKYSSLSGRKGNLPGQKDIYFASNDKTQMTRLSFINNKLHGKYVIWKDNKVILDGTYLENNRISEWWFYDEETKNCIARGNYMGKCLFLDSVANELIFQDNNFKVIKRIKYSQQSIDSLVKYYGLLLPIKFPLEIQFKNGEWKYYSKEIKDKIIKTEYYVKGKLISSK